MLSKLSNCAKESGSFLFTTAMGCGPSQLFGTIRLVVDSSLLLANTIKRSHLQSTIKSAQEWNANGSLFSSSPEVRRIAKKWKIKEVGQETALRYLEAKLRKVEGKIERIRRDIKADAWALVPLVGAHISWRVATDYKGKSFTPIFSRCIRQLLAHSRKAASRPLFMGRVAKSKNEYDLERNRCIDVATSTKRRRLKVEHVCRKNPQTAPTVVLFHPNLGGASALSDDAELYREKGYNTLAVTLGGYAGSPGVTTSEKSMYQDIEAAKKFLQEKGVEKVAYHGFSLGTGAAMQAAAGDTQIDLETLFVVLDQPYVSAAAVGENIAGPLGNGIMAAGVPAGLEVELPGGLWTKTDGLDNLKKNSRLSEKNIPLLCIEGEQDGLMGRDKKEGKYQKSFARDLIAARYEDKEKQAQHLVTIIGGHGISALESPSLLDKGKKFSLLIEKDN